MQRSDTDTDLDLIEACEQRIVNAWPAPQTLILGDCVLRFANGYSGRANSVSALRRGATLSPAEFDFIERLYREAGLPPCIRLTALFSEATQALARARGYGLRDASFGMIAALAGRAAAPEPGLDLAARPGRGWLEGISAFQVEAKRNPAHLAAIVGAIRLEAAFATLQAEGRAAAFAIGVVERGMVEIGAVMVDDGLRGRGLGRRIVAGLMDWAAARGADQAYLQVDQSNAIAIRLYESMGYRRVYAYETCVLA